MKFLLHSLALICCLIVVQGTLSSNKELDEHVINKRQASRVQIQFTEGDYETAEDSGFVTVTLQVVGATSQPLTIQLMPLNISEIRGTRQDDIITLLPQEDPRRPITATSGVDFPTAVVEYELSASTSSSRFVEIQVPIIVDDIHEENQLFALQLTVDGPLQVDTSFRNLTIIRINDNDGVILVWEYPSYTFDETLLKRVKLIKAEGTRTEYTLNIVVQAVQPDIPNFAGLTTDYSLGPPQSSIREIIDASEQSKEINIIIRPDNAFEGEEQFNLRVSNDDSGIPFSSEINGTNRDTTAIIIVDKIELGFTQTSINVTEDQGSVKVCVEENGSKTAFLRVDKIEKTVFLGILTVNGSADGEDYTEYKKVDDQVLEIKDKPVNASHCFLVNITDDNVVEGTEEFEVTLHISTNDSILNNNVILKPKVVVIRIIDNDDDTIPIIVNDTVIGDPLLTVPINVINLESEGFTSNLSLCFELHGESDQYFNLVSDQCVSVNSHYSAVGVFNIVDEIAVKAVDEKGVCRNIMVSLKPDVCAASMDGVEINKMATIDGISIRNYNNRVRISVPNCEDLQLVMWIFCLNQTLQGFNKDDFVTIEARMMKFVIARGFNLKETSHGILGQFWNIPLTVQRYNGSLSTGELASSYYNVTVMPPDSSPRSFPGFLWSVAWEYSTTGERKPCLYSGTKNAGRTSEITELTGSVIEGSYLDYIIDQPFGTDFKYNQFLGTCP